jgi:hypothetical protein
MKGICKWQRLRVAICTKGRAIADPAFGIGLLILLSEVFPLKSYETDKSGSEKPCSAWYRNRVNSG